MGTVSRLHGNLVPLNPSGSIICPNCRREFKKFVVFKRGKSFVKACPFCQYELTKKNVNLYDQLRDMKK